MLTLILQTQEGQKIELNIQLEDTFADLKSQYPDNDGLSDSLEQLITNGAYVPENTKIFDYVTSSANEWFSVDHSADANDNDPQSTVTEIQVKQCCAQGCINSDATADGKLFFPLPTDHDRLAMCLMEIGRPELYNQILGLNAESSEKYYLCGSHFSEEVISSPPLCTAEQSAVSLLKPRNERIWIDIKQESVASEEELREVVLDKHSALEVLNTEVSEHPGILCRLCGESTVNPIYLYAINEENEEFSLADKINLCLPVTITITDPLPKQICGECRAKLNTCHELAMSCLQTEDKLRLLLREKQLCVNDTTEKQCPLCLEGDMSIKKSGIYRKDDLMNESCRSASAKQAASFVSIGKVLSTEDCGDSPPLRVTYTPPADSIPELMQSELVQPIEGDVSLLLVGKEFPCSNCSATIDISSIRTHECSPENRDAYSCLICENTNFAYPHELQVHYRRHGLFGSKFICDLCRYECEDLEEASDHVKSCRPEYWEIRCEACEKAFPSIELINDHQCCGISFDLREPEKIVQEYPTNSPKIRRKEARYHCFFCQMNFSRKRSLQTHISASHVEEMRNSVSSKCFKCRNCNEAFARESDAQVHITLRHLGPFAATDFPAGQEFTPEQLTVSRLYVCEFCERCFTMPSSLHDHRDIEHDSSEFSCLSCESIFNSHRQLANHKSSHCEKRTLNIPGVRSFYVCKYCDKAFLHYSSLSSHVLQHQENAPYLCRPCNVNFETYREIAVHRDIAHPYQSTVHERAKRSYKCQYCQKQFSYEVALVKHIRIHTGEKPYKCAICGKGFAQSSGLNTHVKIHSDVRPYKCPKCPRAFKIKGDCDNHVKRHSGSRPYKCDFCSKSFMTQHVYSQHRRIHTNDRPYKCDLCGEAFRRSHVLTVHRRIHTGEKPHFCDLCPKTYRQRGDLSKHRRVQHGINAAGIAKLAFADNYAENSYDPFAKSNKLADRRGGNPSLLLPL